MHLVRFNHIDYENDARKAITQDEIAAHYEKNKNKYKEKDEIPPLEKVIDRVKSEIAEFKCREKAMDDAHSFAEKAYDLLVKTGDRKVLLDKFKAMAEEQKLVNMETDWIRKGENEIKRVGNEPALAAETAILNYESPVSNPTSGNKAAFVALLTEQRPERPAEFDEVKDQEKDFIKEKALILSREKARNDALEISNALKGGKTFQEIEKDFKSEDVPEFKADSGPSVKDSSTISELSKETRANSVSETRETPTGAIFVLVEKIDPPTDEDFEKEKVKFSDEYKKRKEDVVWNNFLIKVFEAFQPPKEDKGKTK